MYTVVRSVITYRILIRDINSYYYCLNKIQRKLN